MPRGLLCCEGVFATTPAPCWLAEGGAGWCFTTALNLHLETKSGIDQTVCGGGDVLAGDVVREDHA